MSKDSKNITDYIFVLMSNTLEFFDLFLYIHLASIINRVFVPEGSLFLSDAFNLANLYFIAPILSLLMAYFGDNLGRKAILTTCSAIMGLATLFITFLPSYETIGDWATVGFVFLRFAQGVSLSGEPFSAALYIIESVPLRKAPFYLSLLGGTEALGGLLALTLGVLTLFLGVSWRFILIGSFFVLFFSFFLRRKISESPEYFKASSGRRDLIARTGCFDHNKITSFYKKLPFANRNILSFAAINAAYPIAFTVSYIYLSKFLRTHFHYQDIDVLLNNTWVCIFELFFSVTYGYLCSRCSDRPEKWLFFQLLLAMIIAGLMPFLINHYQSAPLVFCLQVVFVSCMRTPLVIPSLLKTFPVIGRFTLAALGGVVNRVVMFLVMTLVFNFFESRYGFYGVTFMICTSIIVVMVGIRFSVFFADKERKIVSQILRHI